MRSGPSAAHSSAAPSDRSRSSPLTSVSPHPAGRPPAPARLPPPPRCSCNSPIGTREAHGARLAACRWRSVRMYVCRCAAIAALVCAAAPAAAQPMMTIDQAVHEAIDRNLSLLAERLNLTIADAAIVTAGLRPNPVLSGGANSLDWLGTGFDDVKGAGPPEYAVRVDVPFERGHKRELRTAVASNAKQIAEAQLADSIRRLQLDVPLAAVAALEARAKLRLARDTQDALQKLVALNERRLTSGAVPPLEVTR